MAERRDQTEPDGAEIRDRYSRQLCPVVWSPSYRIFVSREGSHEFYSLELVHLHATKPLVVRGALIIDCGTLAECRAAIPACFRRMCDMKPSAAIKGILEVWY